MAGTRIQSQLSTMTFDRKKRPNQESVYFQPCSHPVRTSAACSNTCRRDPTCGGFFFTKLDCTAMGGQVSTGVCYLIADAVLAYGERGVIGGPM